MIKLLRYYLESLGSYFWMVFDVAKDIARHGVDRREFLRQIAVIGAASLPIVLLTAIFSGMVLAVQTSYGLYRFGAKNYVGNIVGLALVREMGPVLTALMLCGRVGAGIAAEVSSMVVTEQIDAMRTLGANPIRKLVSPRVLAAMIVLPALTVFADVFGIYGGLLVAVYELGLDQYIYVRGLKYTLRIKDLIDGLCKASVFGFLLVTIACYKGFRTRGGTEGVGRTTTSAVVTSSVIVIIANFFITKMLILLK